MPYDSATGSSGPAHQACEYGVPIVCADIADLREMAVDEDMAVSFYRTGDASDLAEQLTTILSSSELQRRMAEHNYTAGVRMTMSCVIRNYLRWFELQRCKKAMHHPETVRVHDAALETVSSDSTSIYPVRPTAPGFSIQSDNGMLSVPEELPCEGNGIG